MKKKMVTTMSGYGGKEKYAKPVAMMRSEKKEKYATPVAMMRHESKEKYAKPVAMMRMEGKGYANGGMVVKVKGKNC